MQIVNVIAKLLISRDYPNIAITTYIWFLMREHMFKHVWTATFVATDRTIIR